MFSKNYSYYLNLVFSMFFPNKKKKLGMERVLLAFQNKKQFKKIIIKRPSYLVQVVKHSLLKQAKGIYIKRES